VDRFRHGGNRRFGRRRSGDGGADARFVRVRFCIRWPSCGSTQWEGPDFTGEDVQDIMRLGAPFKIIDDATPFRVEVAKRIAALNAAIGERVDA
jgi:hypothetical protein